MDESIKQADRENELEEVAPAHAKHSLSGALGTLATMGVVDILAHLGPTGLVIGGIASYVVWKHGPEVYEQLGAQLSLTAMPELPHMKRKQGGRSFWGRALGRYPQVVESTVDVVEHEQEEDDPIFVQAETQKEVPGVPRITVEQIVRHTERNSYEVYIGRSMSRPNNPAVKINFYKRHLKFIGASQHGKSSMAAACIDAITQSHDPDRVQFALLDLEDKTSRLFAHLPHIARVRKHGETIRLHARSYKQVLEYLGYVSALIDYRYSLSGDELERQPLLIVYLEEFVDLKNHFKQRVQMVGAAEREQARADYTQLIYVLKKIAARALKVQVQLLMCAQVDYRDEDLQEALVNVTAGMSFCVRASAAQAAGFNQTELLARNAKEDKIGQAVVEMPDCKDLILAPDYDLAARLKSLNIHNIHNIHSIHSSPVQGLIEHVGHSVNGNSVNGVNSVNGPVKLVNASVNVGEFSHQSENVSPTFTAAEETQVLLAYAELLKAGKPVTRTGIRDELEWDNKQYTRIVKPVCDKHNIGG
jgi:hypothetical protein